MVERMKKLNKSPNVSTTPWQGLKKVKFIRLHQKSDHLESNYLWALTTLAALYWRVKGDAIEAIKCLRHSIHNSSVEFRVL